MSGMTDLDVRATFAARFNARAGLDRPEPPRPYVRMTDEQIEALPEHLRPLSRSARALADACATAAARMASVVVPASSGLVSRENPGPWPYRELARKEWPHMPLSLAAAYADEYVRTGRKP